MDHLEGVRASLDPANPLEDALAARVALMLWRLNRVARYETAMIVVGQEKASEAVRKVNDLEWVLKPNRPAVQLKAALDAQRKHAETMDWVEPAFEALDSLDGEEQDQVPGDGAWCLLDAARDTLGVEVDFEEEDFLTGVGASSGFEDDWTVGMLRAALARLSGYVRSAGRPRGRSRIESGRRWRTGRRRAGRRRGGMPRRSGRPRRRSRPRSGRRDCVA